MKKFFIIAILFIFAGCGSRLRPRDFIAARDDTVIPLGEAAELFAEMDALFAADDGYLWGIPLFTPFMFVYPPTREIVANQQDSLGILRRVGDVYVGRLPLHFAASYSFQDIGDRRWAVKPWDMAPDMMTMVHMSFHVHQPQLFGNISGVSNAHMNEKDARLKFQLEMNALIHALRNTGEVRTLAVTDALAIRAERRDLFQGIRSEREENLFEVHEGLADYTQFVITGFEKTADDFALRAFYMRYNTMLSGIFGYLAGSLYGFLLDETGVAWRYGIRYGSDLGQLLKEALDITDLPPFEEIDLTLYGFDEIFAFETERILAHENMLATIRDAFDTQTTLLIPAAFQSYSGTIDPSRIFTIDDFGHVFGGVFIFEGDFGRFEMRGSYFVRDLGAGNTFMPSDARVLAEAIEFDGNRVSGEGWFIELNEGFTVREENGSFVLGRNP